MVDKIPIGAAMNKGLAFKVGQTHMRAFTITRRSKRAVMSSAWITITR